MDATSFLEAERAETSVYLSGFPVNQGLSGSMPAAATVCDQRFSTGGAGNHSNHLVETRTQRDMILWLERVDEHGERPWCGRP